MATYSDDLKKVRGEAFSFVQLLERFFSIELTISLFGQPIFHFVWPPKSNPDE